MGFCVCLCCVFMQAKCDWDCVLISNDNIPCDSIWVKWRKKSLHRVSVCVSLNVPQGKIEPWAALLTACLIHACTNTHTEHRQCPVHMSWYICILKHILKWSNKHMETGVYSYFTTTHSVLKITIWSVRWICVSQVIKYYPVVPGKLIRNNTGRGPVSLWSPNN